MRNLLYYPYFEIRNEDWLKFALLYFRNLNLIIPESADRHLSEEFNHLYESTDLFNKFRPDYNSAYVRFFQLIA